MIFEDSSENRKERESRFHIPKVYRTHCSKISESEKKSEKNRKQVENCFFFQNSSQNRKAKSEQESRSDTKYKKNRPPTEITKHLFS